MKELKHTDLEWMPAESHGTPPELAMLDKINHWGYMTMCPMAPHTGYALDKEHPEEEMAQAIRTLKQNGIGTIMDVVPNHTLEGSPSGPLLNLRGMDNSLYLPYDCSGCGNTRDFGHPINQRMFLEELQYWRGLGIAGFRKDLATVLGRTNGAGFDANSAMMRQLHKHPDLQDLKYSGEPWDTQTDQTGKLSPIPKIKHGKIDTDVHDLRHNSHAEWNPDYRDRMRNVALSKDHEVERHLIIDVMAGSSHLYKYPSQSINKPGGGHDGPTLFDAVSSPNGKQNGPNGEGNRDGNDIPNKYYWEKPDDRLRVQRFSKALLAISQGVPMSTIGFERCHTQHSNTNLYCLPKNPDDPYNHAAWIKHEDRMDDDAKAMMAFTKQANQFRAKHFALRRGVYLKGTPDKASDLTFNGDTMKDVTWLYPDARELDNAGMHSHGGFGMLLSGDPGNSPSHEQSFLRKVQRKGRDSPLLVLVNPTGVEKMDFTLPDVPGVKWHARLNSEAPDHLDVGADNKVKVGWHSLIVFEGERELEKSVNASRTHETVAQVQR